MMKSPQEIGQTYVNASLVKTKQKNVNILLLSVLAGMFLSLSAAGANTAAAAFYGTPYAKLAASLVFPAGLAMILFAGGELFTGNNLLIMTVLSGKMRISKMLSI